MCESIWKVDLFSSAELTQVKLGQSEYQTYQTLVSLGGQNNSFTKSEIPTIKAGSADTPRQQGHSLCPYVTT